MNPPRVTVVTVAFNAEQTILRTLLSVRAQRGLDIEHILVDGMSTDRTVEIARQVGGFAKIIQEPDQGVYDAMNKGLAAASGEFVGFLNADDCFLKPDSLAELLDEKTVSAADIVYGDVAFVNRQYRPTRIIRPRWGQTGMALGLIPPHPAFYVRTAVARAAGAFDKGFRIAGDADLVLRLADNPALRWRYRRGIVTCMSAGGISTRDLQAVVSNGRELELAFAKNGRSAFHTMARLPFKLIEVMEGRLARLGHERFSPPEEWELSGTLQRH